METKEFGGPVTVLQTSDPGLLGVAKSLLEGAGIRYIAKGEGLQDLFGAGRAFAAFNPIVGPVEVQVAQEDAERALELLGPLDTERGGA